jgi:hypothetical protein
MFNLIEFRARGIGHRLRLRLSLSHGLQPGLRQQGAVVPDGEGDLLNADRVPGRLGRGADH